MQKNKPLTLRRNFSWTFLGNVTYAGCQWGMLVVLAKLGNPEMVGQFTLGIAVTAPVIMFTNLQLRVVQTTDAKHQYAFGDYLGLRLLSTTLALVIITGISFLGGYRWETSLVIFLIGLAKALESISDVFHGLLQQHEQMDRVALSMFIRGLLSLILLSLAVYITGSVVWGSIGLVIAWALVLICYDLNSGASILNLSLDQLQNRQFIVFKSLVLPQPHWHLETLRNLAWLAMPLGFMMMLFSLNTNIPRYLIEKYLGSQELGIFAAIAYLMMVGHQVVIALGESASPRLAKYYCAQDSKAFRQLIFKLIGIGAFLGCVGVVLATVAGKEILTILYSPEYALQSDLFVLLMVAATISYVSILLGYGMTAARYFRIQIPLVASSAIISVMVCFWLLPIMRLRGAAIALIVSASLQVVMSLGVIIQALKRINKNFFNKYYLK